MILGIDIVYLVISLALTVWVAQTLYKNGRPFLIESFLGNATLADSVNHLLVVGFYLINVGYIAIAFGTESRPANLEQAMETTAHKLGVVLLVLGIMHFLNMKIFSSMRRRAIRASQPPVAPAQRLEKGVAS